jgi:hypothetical protein
MPLHFYDRDNQQSRFVNNAADHSRGTPRLSKQFTILWKFGLATPATHMMLWFLGVLVGSFRPAVTVFSILMRTLTISAGAL